MEDQQEKMMKNAVAVKKEEEQPPPMMGAGGGGGGDQGRPEKEKCPRCNSTDTKFCYFNNYSLSQPRHYCKTCRRYWTKGGTLRNVPVGGGSRKGKRSKKLNEVEPSPLPPPPPPPPPLPSDEPKLEPLLPAGAAVSYGGNSFLATLASFHPALTHLGSPYGLPSEDFNLQVQATHLQPPATNYQNLLFDVDDVDKDHPDMSTFWVNKSNDGGGAEEPSSSRWPPPLPPEFPGYGAPPPPPPPPEFPGYGAPPPPPPPPSSSSSFH